jgi:hypothetical protein
MGDIFVNVLNEDEEWSERYIKAVDSNTYIELGTKKRGDRIHSHTLLKTQHTTKI